MLIIPLGINGYMPSFGRQTATILVIDNGHAAILDAGTGLARLREPRIKSLVDRCDTVSIILSHYHLDHVIGLTYLPDVLPDREVTIFAPAPPLTDYGPDEALSHLFHQSLFSLDLPRFPVPPRIVPLREREATHGPHAIRVQRQAHDGGSLAIRLGGLVYVTDTPASRETVAFAGGASLLLHEVWFDGASPGGDRSRHSDAREVAAIAVEAKASRLAPVHLNPAWDPERVLQVCAAMNGIHGSVAVPLECEPIVF